MQTEQTEKNWHPGDRVWVHMPGVHGHAMIHSEHWYSEDCFKYEIRMENSGQALVLNADPLFEPRDCLMPDFKEGDGVFIGGVAAVVTGPPVPSESDKGFKVPVRFSGETASELRRADAIRPARWEEPKFVVHDRVYYTAGDEYGYVADVNVDRPKRTDGNPTGNTYLIRWEGDDVPPRFSEFVPESDLAPAGLTVAAVPVFAPPALSQGSQFLWGGILFKAGRMVKVNGGAHVLVCNVVEPHDG